jgi:hypothetical protein
MNTDTPTVPRDLQAHTNILAKMQALKPYVFGLMLIVPACFISFMMMQSRTDWPHSQQVMIVILGLMITNFLMLVVLEPYRSVIGKLTIPAMLAFIGVTIFCLLMEALNRFVFPHGFGWAMPFAIGAMAVIYASVLREPNTALKFFLCINGLGVTVLWCLGDAGRLSLPF